MTSSATKTTPHSGHLVESNGTSELHAPHSPNASSDTPEKEIPHSGQFSESIGTTARQEPHSAIAISSFSSVIPLSPVLLNTSAIIILHEDFNDETYVSLVFW